MQDEPCLRPVTTDELVETIALALRYDGRGRLAAERLTAHLEQSGFVVMKKPPLRPHRTPGERPVSGQEIGG